MTSVSALVITKNEETMLQDCLQSISWADEIVVLDSGSTDNTLKLANQFGAKVYEHCDWQGFGRQRQIAQDYASCEWLFWIDADERVSDDLATEIRQKVSENKQDNVYEIPRLSWVFGRYIRHSGWYPDYVVRLYARNRTTYDDALVHEKVIVPAGATKHKLKADLIHYTYQDLHHYLTKSARYAQLWADQKQQRDKTSTLLQAVLHALGCFVKMYFLKRGFLDGRQGFLLALLSSHSSFIKYADLWVRQQKKKDN